MAIGRSPAGDAGLVRATRMELLSMRGQCIVPELISVVKPLSKRVSAVGAG